MRLDSVNTVAIGANCSACFPSGHGMAVHTALISNEGLRTQTAGLHHEHLPVAGAACLRDVGVINARVRIAGRKEFMRAAVAINARCRILVARDDRFGMKAAIVDDLLVLVALGATHLRRRRVVHGILDVGVAIHAREHVAVDRSFELLRRDIETDWLAADFLAQRGVAVASQTIVVGGLLCGPRPK